MPAVEVEAGVPQGSPFSPILFLLFLRPLYDALRQPGTQLISFADDTSILAVGHTRYQCLERLAHAYTTAQEWANKVGMSIALDKSTLLNFKRGGQPDTTPLALSGGTV